MALPELLNKDHAVVHLMQSSGLQAKSLQPEDHIVNVMCKNTGWDGPVSDKWMLIESLSLKGVILYNFLPLTQDIEYTKLSGQMLPTSQGILSEALIAK